MDFLKKIFSGIDKAAGEKVQKHKGLYIALSLVAIAAIVCAAILLNQKKYTVLYSGMTTEDAGEMLTMLEEMSWTRRRRARGQFLWIPTMRTRCAWSSLRKDIRRAA